MNSSPLRREELNALLERLDAGDRDRAAAGYEALRARLTRYFGWEGALEAEELADETLTRLGRRIASGEAVQNVAAFSSGIARLVMLEYRRDIRNRPTVQPEVLAALPAPGAAEQDRAAGTACLERCLAELDADARALILEYYSGDAGARIRNRARLAQQLGITLNSLRNRALRLRERLEKCMKDC